MLDFYGAKTVTAYVDIKKKKELALKIKHWGKKHENLNRDIEN